MEVENKEEMLEKIVETLKNDNIQKMPSLMKQEGELGIDEAGRGPVLGPMVYAYCTGPITLKKQLASIGFADSKKLSEKKRDQFFEIIKNLNGICLFYETISLHPDYLSNKMLQKEKYNLNFISFDTAFTLIHKAISSKINLTQVFIDTVGSAKAYEEKLNREFGFSNPEIKFRVEEKADAKFPVVSAASICAKVTRDSIIENGTFIEKGLKCSKELGSGYPGDPVTKKWLKTSFDKVFGFPDLVRFSGSTIKDLFENEKLLIDFFDENENTEAQNKSITSGIEPITQKKGMLSKLLQISNDFSL